MSDERKAYGTLLDRIENDFTYHAPKPGQAETYNEIRGFAKDFARFLATTCPVSRELSLSLTSLEEAVFWANASVARNDPK